MVTEAKKAAARGTQLPPLQLSLQFGREVRSHRETLPRSRVARWLRAALERPGELTVRIVDEIEARALNRDYRQKDYATNVLTFNYSDDPVVIADLVLCGSVVEREADEMGIALADHYAHLLIHGGLHAQAYDHLEDAEASRMEARETEILAQFGIADPYARE